MKKVILIIFILCAITGCEEKKVAPVKQTTKEDETVTVLKNIGYHEDVIGVLMNRLSKEEITLLKEYDYIADINEYVNLEYFDFTNLNRYIEYKDTTDYDYETVVTYVNIGLDKDFYDPEIIQVSKIPDETTVLVNKYHQLPSDYKPELINVSSACGSGQLKKVAKEAFENMCMEAKAVGYSVRSISAYRSYDYQYKLYNGYVKQDGVKLTDTYSARAGHSEHQTGLATDIGGSFGSYLDFINTKEFDWVNENAHLYGFIIRYPKGKEDITGYQYEPWHIRYVGKEIATYLYEHNITYDEYYARFLSK